MVVMTVFTVVLMVMAVRVQGFDLHIFHNHAVDTDDDFR